jgi:hypothetical protein
MPSAESERGAIPARVNRGALTLWSCLAGVSVLMAVHVLHSLIDHTLAIIGSAFLGVFVGCLGYGGEAAIPREEGSRSPVLSAARSAFSLSISSRCSISPRRSFGQSLCGIGEGST